MALAEAGETDLAYKAIATETYPSYGYMLNNNYTNATTIWESWPFSDNTFSHDHPVRRAEHHAAEHHAARVP